VRSEKEKKSDGHGIHGIHGKIKTKTQKKYEMRKTSNGHGSTRKYTEKIL
jgi:hypothetical protein